LETTCTTTTDRRLCHRCQALLMAARGRRHAHIAADLNGTTRTTQRWRNAYRQQRVDGLRMQWAPGRAPLIAATRAPDMLPWIKPGPAGGRDRTHWTSAELATSLSQPVGLSGSETTRRTLCTTHGVCP
jgi:transposase